MTPVYVNMQPAVCLAYYATEALHKKCLCEKNSRVYNVILYTKLRCHGFCSRLIFSGSFLSLPASHFFFFQQFELIDILLCKHQSSDTGQALFASISTLPQGASNGVEYVAVMTCSHTNQIVSPPPFHTQKSRMCVCIFFSVHKLGRFCSV